MSWDPELDILYLSGHLAMLMWLQKTWIVVLRLWLVVNRNCSLFAPERS